MKIAKEVLGGIYHALGFKTAKEWPAEKLGSADQLKKLQGQVDEDTNLGELDPPLRKLMTALENEDAITITEAPAEVPAETAEAAPEKPAKKAAKKAAPAAAADDDEKPAAAPKKAPVAKAAAEASGDDEVKEKPAEPKPAKPAKAAKKAAEPKPPKEPKPPRVRKGVTEARARPYLAGLIIKAKLKKAGKKPSEVKDIGIDDADVALLNKTYGKANDNESLFCLRNAWHAIRGCCTVGNEDDLGIAAPAAAAE